MGRFIKIVGFIILVFIMVDVALIRYDIHKINQDGVIVNILASNDGEAGND